MLTQKEMQGIAEILDFAFEHNFVQPLKEVGAEYAGWLASLDKSRKRELAKFSGQGKYFRVEHPLLFDGEANNCQYAILNEDGKIDVRAKLDKKGNSFILTFGCGGFEPLTFGRFAMWVCGSKDGATPAEFVEQNAERNAAGIVKVSDYAQANWTPLVRAVRDVTKEIGAAIEKIMEDDAEDVRRNEAELRAAFRLPAADGWEVAK
jgi:hypothetical protein